MIELIAIIVSGGLFYLFYKDLSKEQKEKIADIFVPNFIRRINKISDFQKGLLAVVAGFIIFIVVATGITIYSNLPSSIEARKQETINNELKGYYDSIYGNIFTYESAQTQSLMNYHSDKKVYEVLGELKITVEIIEKSKQEIDTACDKIVKLRPEKKGVAEKLKKSNAEYVNLVREYVKSYSYYLENYYMMNKNEKEIYESEIGNKGNALLMKYEGINSYYNELKE